MDDSIQVVAALPAPGVDGADPVDTPADVIDGEVVETEVVEPEVSPVPEPPEASAELPATDNWQLATNEQRELDKIWDESRGGVRQGILRALARDGRTSVGVLAERLGIDQKQLRRHLHDLCGPDLIFGERKGKNVFYQTTPGPRPLRPPARRHPRPRPHHAGREGGGGDFSARVGRRRRRPLRLRRGPCR